jgi:TusA-related sulfurtransferase
MNNVDLVLDARDMKSFCNQTGHELLSSEQQGAEYIFMVRKI